MSTYTPIASVTLDSAQSSVTFSGIPQTYTDLVLIINAKVISGSAVNNYLRFNGDSGSNYSETRLYGNGSSASSSRQSNQSSGILFNDITSSENTADIVHIMNYTNNTTYKTTLTRANVVGSTTQAGVGLWRNTSAITSIEVSSPSTNFASGSTFNIYGVANASITNTAKATGGDSITTDGTYWYHTFLSSGTFTPTEELTADYLVVAGGGGGGRNNGGGGGAGGLRCTVTATGGGGSVESALSLTAQAYTVTVGAGGTGQVTTTLGTQGSNSVFSTITSTGGGYGGGYNGSAYVEGGSGGSGGGAAGGNSLSGGAGTTNQGYAGGNSSSSGSESGGGGGAGAVGANGVSGTPGSGGNGVASSITGSSTTYAGGGGGGQRLAAASTGLLNNGGTGGGGSGAKATNASGGQNGSAGTANTGGGGGGGSRDDGNGANGGSGIVIVRYAV